MLSQQTACSRTSLTPADLHDPARQIALLERDLSDDLARAAANHTQRGPRLILVRGTPDAIRGEIAGLFPETRTALLDDAINLARLYGKIAHDPIVRLRLERITDDSCRKFHTDNVTIRMLCAYVGPGVQWLGSDETVHDVGTGHVALLKGRKFADQAGILHRSPPLSHLPLCRRLRLLLTIDAPDACGLPADHTLTVMP